MNGYLLLILAGGPASMLVPLLVARALVNRNDTAVAFEASVIGEYKVATAEAIAAQRPKELIR